MSALITAEDLLVGFNDPLLGPLSFALQRGDIVGLWGPNGVGKSTLLQTLIGAVDPLRGRVQRAEGLRITYQQQRATRLRLMPVSGREYLRYMHALSDDIPQPLRHLLNRRIDRLSGGQYQLLSVWVCIASGADLTILDEPTNNLDPRSLDVLTGLLRHRAGERSVLLVSHEQTLLREACTEVLEVSQWT